MVYISFAFFYSSLNRKLTGNIKFPIQEAEAGGSEFEASLGSIVRSCLKEKRNIKY